MEWQRKGFIFPSSPISFSPKADLALSPAQAIPGDSFLLT